MQGKASLVVALIVIGIFPALSLYIWGNAPEYTENVAVWTATQFLKNGPTFSFDGIEGSIEVLGVEPLRTPDAWGVTIAFESSHAGYGDRSGMMLAQVITPHEARMVISEGEVIKAIIDDQWDEIKQHEVTQGKLLPPENAKDLAIEYILEHHHGLEAITTPDAWAFEVLTSKGLIGASTMQFVGGGWTVNISFPVVMKPIYTISVHHSGEVSFNWEGTVDQEGKVQEFEFSLEH